MNVALIAAVLIAAAALIGAWRTMQRLAPRRALRVALQLIAAALIYFALFPPTVPERFAAGTLVVLTPGITQQQASAISGGIATVALPGTVATRDVEQVPDLGTALRRHPDTARLRIVGGGLPPRDVDAARALPIDFDAASPGDGIVDLTTPASVRAGSAFAISGRVQGDPGGRVELRDPAGAVVANAMLADDGAFSLNAQAKASGNFVFALRVVDRAGAKIEEIAQPVAVLSGDALRVLMLAGAPDPELKYLRRWATDAGIDLASRIVLSEGIAIDDGDTPVTADSLARTDLVIVDERAWKALGADTKTLLTNAARDGLGLFLRVTGTLPDAVAADWQALGFRVRATDVAEATSLAQPAGAPDPAAVLSRRALLVESEDATPLLRVGDGSAAALWRSNGRGRVAIWWLADSYRIALAGDAGAFGSLWSRALATVARARGASSLDIPDDARVDRRNVLCGLTDDAYVEQPDGTHAALAIDAARDARRCAAFWPATEGWHALVSGGQRAAFYAFAPNAAPALVTARNAEATRVLAGGATAAASATATREIPASRWPFFAGWLAVVAILWWLERSKPAVVET